VAGGGVVPDKPEAGSQCARIAALQQAVATDPVIYQNIIHPLPVVHILAEWS
jgi:hypothetical protein